MTPITDVPLVRLWRVEVDTHVRSDGFVVIAQRGEDGCGQMLVLEREQLHEIARFAEKAFRAHEREQRKTGAST